jgi:KaiC
MGPRPADGRPGSDPPPRVHVLPGPAVLPAGHQLLTTYETPGLPAAGSPPDFAVSHLAGDAVVLGRYRDHDTMTRSLAIIKTRASSHHPAMRPFTIGPDGVTIGDTTTPAAPPHGGKQA